jgi:predicted DNA-binding protein (MmcQ/YjbR family)
MARNGVQKQDRRSVDRQELEALIKTSYDLVVAKLPKRLQPQAKPPHERGRGTSG